MDYFYYNGSLARTQFDAEMLQVTDQFSPLLGFVSEINVHVSCFPNVLVAVVTQSIILSCFLSFKTGNLLMKSKIIFAAQIRSREVLGSNL
jgi:hypothetical protein